MRWTAVATVVFVAATALPASAATHTVNADSRTLSWSPERVAAVVGDQVTWNNDGGIHNVRSTTLMFRSGDPGTFVTYSRMFSAGTFPYYCEFHGTGMSGVIRVRPRTTAAPPGLPFKVRWATDSTNTGGRFRVQFRVGSGDWRTWLADTTRRAAVFGRNGAPVEVRSGRDYRFRVKSLRNNRSSGYSPVKRFST